MRHLEQLASTIPSMGGTAIGPYLRKVAREAPANSSIVEVGTWLGAGTAQLALGVLDRGEGNVLPIHCYDRWTANSSEAEKATTRGLQVHAGEDTLDATRRFLDPFGAPITYHKGDLRQARWNGGPISIYVDDAAKSVELFNHVLSTFGPSWVPGATVVVLMDFYLGQRRADDRYKYQETIMARYADHFQRIEDPSFEGTIAASFRYMKPLNFSVFRKSPMSLAASYGKRLARRLITRVR